MKKHLFSEEVSRSDLGLTAGLFAAAIACLVLVIQILPMPSRARVDRSLESFFLESMAIAANTPSEDELVIEDATPEFLEEPEVTLEDFDGLLSSFTNLSLSETASPEVQETKVTESSIQAELELDFSTAADAGGVGRTDLDAGLFPQAERSTETWTLRPNIVSGSSDSRNVPLADGAGVAEDDLTLRRADSTQLEFLESAYEGLDRSALTPEEAVREDAVVLWMTARSTPLDPAIQALFELESTDLVFKGTALVDGQTWVVQLSYSPINRTLKIALIQGSALFYFIDPGLQDKANYYEQGRVVRDADDRVASVESEEFSVQSPDAIRMFNLFLSWWSNALRSDG